MNDKAMFTELDTCLRLLKEQKLTATASVEYIEKIYRHLSNIEERLNKRIKKNPDTIRITPEIADIITTKTRLKLLKLLIDARGLYIENNRPELMDKLHDIEQLLVYFLKEQIDDYNIDTIHHNLVASNLEKSEELINFLYLLISQIEKKTFGKNSYFTIKTNLYEKVINSLSIHITTQIEFGLAPKQELYKQFCHCYRAIIRSVANQPSKLQETCVLYAGVCVIAPKLIDELEQSEQEWLAHTTIKLLSHSKEASQIDMIGDLLPILIPRMTQFDLLNTLNHQVSNFPKTIWLKVLNQINLTGMNQNGLHVLYWLVKDKKRKQDFQSDADKEIINKYIQTLESINHTLINTLETSEQDASECFLDIENHLTTLFLHTPTFNMTSTFDILNYTPVLLSFMDSFQQETNNYLNISALWLRSSHQLKKFDHKILSNMYNFLINSFSSQSEMRHRIHTQFLLLALHFEFKLDFLEKIVTEYYAFLNLSPNSQFQSDHFYLFCILVRYRDLTNNFERMQTCFLIIKETIKNKNEISRLVDKMLPSFDSSCQKNQFIHTDTIIQFTHLLMEHEKITLMRSNNILYALHHRNPLNMQDSVESKPMIGSLYNQIKTENDLNERVSLFNVWFHTALQIMQCDLSDVIDCLDSSIDITPNLDAFMTTVVTMSDSSAPLSTSSCNANAKNESKLFLNIATLLNFFTSNQTIKQPGLYWLARILYENNHIIESTDDETLATVQEEYIQFNLKLNEIDSFAPINKKNALIDQFNLILFRIKHGEFYGTESLCKHEEFISYLENQYDKLIELQYINLPECKSIEHVKHFDELSTYFHTIIEHMFDAREQQMQRHVERKKERTIRNDVTLQQKYFHQLTILCNKKVNTIHSINEIKNILVGFKQFSHCYDLFQYHLFNLRLALLERQRSTASSILTELSNATLQPKQKFTISVLKLDFFRLMDENDKAIQLLDEHIIPYLEGTKRSNFVLKKANIMLYLGRISDAIDVVEKEIPLVDKENLSLKPKVLLFYCRAAIFAQKQTVAKEYIDQLAHLRETYMPSYYNCLAEYNKTFKVEEFDIESIGYDILSHHNYQECGSVYSYLIHKNHIQCAEKFLNKIQHDYPGSYKALLWEASYHISAKKFDKAQTIIDKTINLYGENIGIIILQASIYSHQNAYLSEFNWLKKIPERSQRPDQINRLIQLKKLLDLNAILLSTVIPKKRLPKSNHNEDSKLYDQTAPISLIPIIQSELNQIEKSTISQTHHEYPIPEHTPLHHALKIELSFLREKKIAHYVVGSSLFALIVPNIKTQTTDIDIAMPFCEHAVLTEALFKQTSHLKALYKKRIFTAINGYYAEYNIDLFLQSTNKSSLNFIDEHYPSRDFTISCLFGEYYSDASGDGLKIIDPTGRGINDLKTATLRTVASAHLHLETECINADKAHLEADPVRILRAIKWIMQGFKPTTSLMDALKICSITHGDIAQTKHLYLYTLKILQSDKNCDFFRVLKEYQLMHFANFLFDKEASHLPIDIQQMNYWERNTFIKNCCSILDKKINGDCSNRPPIQELPFLTVQSKSLFFNQKTHQEVEPTLPVDFLPK
jgi:hypothetical protein